MSNVKKGQSNHHIMIEMLCQHVEGVMEDFRLFPQHFRFPETDMQDKVSCFHAFMQRDAFFYEIAMHLKVLTVQANDLHDNGNVEARQNILNSHYDWCNKTVMDFEHDIHHHVGTFPWKTDDEPIEYTIAKGNYTCLRDILFYLKWYCETLYHHYQYVESTSIFKEVDSIMDEIGKLENDDNYGIYMLERKFNAYRHYSVEEQKESLVSIKGMISHVMEDAILLILRVQHVQKEYEIYVQTDDAASDASTRPGSPRDDPDEVDHVLQSMYRSGRSVRSTVGPSRRYMGSGVLATGRSTGRSAGRSVGKSVTVRSSVGPSRRYMGSGKGSVF